jgi:histidinol-phosphate aminotransferase
MKNFNLENLLRDNIKALQPYSSARDEFSGEGDYLFFDANENALGSVGSELDYNRYPDPYQREVKALIAEQKGIETNQIFLGNGSDEAIDLLFRAFCEPKQDKVIITPPTYGMYQVSANINDVECIKIPLTEDYQPSASEIIEAANTSNAKLIFICSPNNPTGNLIDEQIIISIVENTNSIVVVDEAYIDFAPEKSMIRYLNDYSNLVILQTFSKAWGLANLRLGKAFASKEIIQIFNNIKPPYNVNGYTQKIAIQALKNVAQKNQYVQQIIEERKKFKAAILKLDLVEKVYPSDTNFLLVKIKADATAIYNQLIQSKIVVRNRSKVVLCNNCLRFTIGTASENKELLKRLRDEVLS